jgi:hypothetical protein
MNVLKEIGAQVAHTLLAMAILAPVVFAPGPWKILGGAVSGYLAGLVREDAQHRTPDKTPEGWNWYANGFPASGRHRDMYAFAVGGLAIGLIRHFTS